MTNPAYPRISLIAWVVLFLAVLAWSGWQPADRATWWLEVIPALAGFVILAVVYPRFRFTSLVAWLILAHAVVLMIGGHYTYAEVPVGFQVSELFGWSRNNYDKLGHVAQGFVPALVARELLLRLGVVARRGWLGVVAVSMALAISAFYELAEWWVALASDEAAESFLGTQGYVWDTQSDMAWALGGALFAVLIIGAWQDRQIARFQAH